MELLALRAVEPRGAGGWVEGASLTTAEPPALRGLVLSQRDKTHHRVPATFNRTRKENPMAWQMPASRRSMKELWMCRQFQVRRKSIPWAAARPMCAASVAARGGIRPVARIRLVSNCASQANSAAQAVLDGKMIHYGGRAGLVVIFFFRTAAFTEVSRRK